MFKIDVRYFFLELFILFCGLSQAQFANTLVSQQPKPKVTPSEMESDSAHYMDKPNNFKNKHNNIVHAVWTEFDKYKSLSKKDSSFIVYGQMAAPGKPWTNMQRLSKITGDCSNGDNTLKPDAPCLGVNGEVYVCWASPKGVAFQKSLDDGAMWMAEEKIIAPIVNGWDQEVKGMRTTGIPRMAVVEEGTYKGRIYITWSDEKNGKNNKDVFLVYSDDGGNAWSQPVLVTYRPNHKEQFNPAIAVQPGTGHLYLTFFDTQNYVEGNFCDLYLGVSYNGGEKFYFYKLNENPVVLDSNIASVRGLGFIPNSNEIKVGWSQLNTNNMLSIYSAYVNDTTLRSYAKRYNGEQMVIANSVGFDDIINVNFELMQDAKVTAILTKALDPSYSVEVLRDADFSKGSNTLEIDTKKLAVKNGNYILTLYYNSRNNFVWITKK